MSDRQTDLKDLQIEALVDSVLAFKETLAEARAEADDYKDRWVKCVKVQSDYRSGRMAKQTKAEFRKLRKQVQVLTEMVQQLVKERQ